MSVGLRIAQKRMELGLNQTELAQRAGLKPAAINQYESGERRPSYEALIKLAGALKVSTDYLIGSGEPDNSITDDPTVKTVLKTIQCLSDEKKSRVLEFAFFLLNHEFPRIGHIFGDTGEYAGHILRQTSQDSVPVDLDAIAASLQVRILEVTGLECEGVLVKEPGRGMILLDSETGDPNRRRFTTAHLLGHYVIPWHLKSVFYCRSYGTSSLKTLDVLEMEANRFAAALLMPRLHLERDIINRRPSIKQLESLAHEKYRVSLFALVNMLIECTGNRYALVNSRNNKIEKAYQGDRPLVEKLNPNTIAAGFFIGPPAEKTTRSGYVPASFWFLDASPGETVYEESMYNPELSAVLTLLTSLDDEPGTRQ